MNEIELSAESEITTEGVRAMHEVQASIVIAKKFPRDIFQTCKRINTSCERFSLAEKAMYSYPRGGQMVTGPSIRLAEVIAQNYGNLDFGIREIEQGNGESKVEAYCWDKETNVRQSKVFTVKHERHTRRGVNKLKDPRDIYELVANQGARRLRACILGIIPADIVEEAVAICNKTLEKGNGVPFQDRLKKAIQAFSEIGVDQAMLESRLGHKIDITTPQELSQLIKIYTSLKDGMSKREDWFEFQKRDRVDEKAEKLNKKLLEEKSDESQK